MADGSRVRSLPSLALVFAAAACGADRAPQARVEITRVAPRQMLADSLEITPTLETTHDAPERGATALRVGVHVRNASGARRAVPRIAFRAVRESGRDTTRGWQFTLEQRSVTELQPGESATYGVSTSPASIADEGGDGVYRVDAILTDSAGARRSLPLGRVRLLSGDSAAKPAPPRASASADVDSAAIMARARDALAALTQRDGARLAALVHPVRGVRFSPYAYVDTTRHVVLTRDEVRTAFTDATPRLWGEADGTGDPIRAPFADYHRRFISDVDFAAAPRTAFDQPPLRAGNAPGNLREAYPGAHWVEFHFPGFDEKYGGMDWRSLWLVFTDHQDEWFLTGVAHGSWTI